MDNTDDGFIWDPTDKPIFLDVDGVCNHYNLRNWAGHNTVSADCILALYVILAQTKSKIVVTSTWRVTGLDSFKENFKLCMEQAGLTDYVINKVLDAIVSITLDFDKDSRGKEIQEWLDSNGYTGKFAILDDVEIHFDGSFGDNLFITSDKTGLTIGIAERVVKHLNDTV